MSYSVKTSYQLWFGNTKADGLLCDSIVRTGKHFHIKLQTPLGEIEHTGSDSDIPLLLNFFVSNTADKWDEFLPEWDFNAQRANHSKYDETLQAAAALFTYAYSDITCGVYPSMTIYDKLPPRKKLYVYSIDRQKELAQFNESPSSCNMLRYNLLSHLIKGVDQVISYRLWCSLFYTYINTEHDFSARLWSKLFGGPRQIDLGPEKVLYKKLREDRYLAVSD